MNLIICCGGTGGHISPGVALASVIHEKREAFHLESLRIQSLVRNKDNPDLLEAPCEILWHNTPSFKLQKILIFPFLLTYSILKTCLQFKKLKVDTVIAMGGYSGIPAILYAILFRKKLFLCEQNCEPGLVTKFFSRFAQKTALSFPLVNPKVILSEAKVLGNPLRESVLPSIQAMKLKIPNSISPKNQLNVLVLGGSQGARQINSIVLKLNQHLQIRDAIKFRIITGSNLYDETLKKKNGNQELISYTKDMKSNYEWAQLVIARSGAGVLAECSAYSLPMILVPYPFASDNHQEANASYFVEKGAAWKLTQVDEDETKIARILISIIENPQILKDKAIASFACSNLNASYNTLKYFFQVEL